MPSKPVMKETETKKEATSVMLESRMREPIHQKGIATIETI